MEGDNAKSGKYEIGKVGRTDQGQYHDMRICERFFSS